MPTQSRGHGTRHGIQVSSTSATHAELIAGSHRLAVAKDDFNHLLAVHLPALFIGQDCQNLLGLCVNDLPG
jgi:hypothetical protein